MYSVSDFKKGLPIMVDGQPWRIVEFSHFKMGRGNAKVRTKLKHIKTGQVLEQVFLTSDTFAPPDLEKRKMQFLYENTGELTFMDSETFDQLEVPRDKFGDLVYFLRENEEYGIQFLDGEPIGLEMAASVIMTVTSTEPVIKGDRVSNVTKPAVLDTGLEIRVPPFIEAGDRIKVDTRSSEYIERA